MKKRFILASLFLALLSGKSLSDESVKAIQWTLSYLGYDIKKLDGKAGKKSDAALQKFIADYNAISRSGKLEAKKSAGEAFSAVANACLGAEIDEKALKLKRELCFAFTSNLPQNQDKNVFFGDDVGKLALIISECGYNMDNRQIIKLVKAGFEKNRSAQWAKILGFMPMMFKSAVDAKFKEGSTTCDILKSTGKTGNDLIAIALVAEMLSTAIKVTQEMPGLQGLSPALQ
jgi:hypothetical protein